MKQIVNSNDDNASNTQKIKFLYSYGGKILPRPTDGVLRYVGGHTRVLSVDRSITFAELMVRFLELCGSSMTLKCKLPIEDLDVLVTITCDEELVNIIEEYGRFSSSTNKDLKITAVLFPLKSLKTISPPPSTVSSLDFSSVILPSPGFWISGGGARKESGKVLTNMSLSKALQTNMSLSKALEINMSRSNEYRWMNLILHRMKDK